MVRELQKKFIKSTMMVVTIMLVVFLTSVIIINYTLSRKDSRSTLDQIVTRRMNQMPGMQRTGSENGPFGAAGQEQPPSGEMQQDAPQLPYGEQQAMSEPSFEGSQIQREFGLFFIAMVNSKGAVTYSDLTHAGDVKFEDMISIINGAKVEFAATATGETEIPKEPVSETEPEAGTKAPGSDTLPQGAEAPAEMREGAEAPDSNMAPQAAPVPQDQSAMQEPESGQTSLLENAPKSAEGQSDGYLYYASQQPDGSVAYAFLNISQEMAAIVRISLITLVLGIALWFLILLLVVFLSKRAIAPIAENIEKQRQFITNAGHEIKTPLAVIVSNVDVQELHTGKSKWLDNIRSQALRLSDLTKQMLTLSKMEELGGGGFVSTTFDASEQVEEAVRLFRPSASLRGIEVRTQIESGLYLHMPKEQYRQMLELLLDNALKYGRENGFLSVSLKGERKVLRLSFQNDCDKLPEVDPDRLFDRFYRADESRSRQTGGSGIGLSVVRAIAEYAGGNAHAGFHSGEVIEFVIEIPVAQHSG